MMDPAERRLRYLVRLMGPVLLPGWTIVLHVGAEPLPVKASDEAAGYRCIGRCAAKWEYCEATLEFDLDAFADLPQGAQAEFVLHELLHAVVNEMRSRGLAHEERVVSSLTSAFVRALSTPAIRKELRLRPAV
jgi:hypothetical protein